MNGAEACQNKGHGTVAVKTQQIEDPARGENNFVILEVSDTGDGIPQGVMPKIFDPFFTTKGEGKGIGLGLSVVYGIIDAHGGDIDVNSKVGEGTTFMVTLPVKKGRAEHVDGTKV